MGGGTGPAVVCSMVPERLADVISEVLNSKNFLHFAWIINYTWQMGISNRSTETHETDYGTFM